MVKDKDGKDYLEWNFFIYWWKILPTVWEKLSWLWFLLALYINSLINYPLICWSSRRHQNIPIDWKVDAWYLGGITFAMIIWSLINSIGPNGTGPTELIPMCVILLCYFLTIMFIQIPLSTRNPDYYIIIKLIGPVFCFMLNAYRDGKN